jgi:hypothetical protein
MDLYIRPGKFNKTNWSGNEEIKDRPIFKMGDVSWNVKGSEYGKFVGFLRLDKMEYNVVQKTYELADLLAAVGGL